MRRIAQNLAYRILSRVAPLAGAYPLNDRLTRSVSPVMIVGCGRSGNTLLRSMLVRGGEIAIPPESYVWPAVARGFSRWRYKSWATVANHAIDAFKDSEFGLSGSELDLMKRRAKFLPGDARSLAAVIDLIYRTWSDLNGYSGRRWGDKTPFNILDIAVIEDIFPAAQFVHVVRDPRAVALSFVKAARKSAKFRERTVADAANRWMWSVRNARALAQRVGPPRYFEIRYEDLVQAPEQQLRKMCAFLGQSFTPAMLSFHEIANTLGDVPAYPHHARVHQPLDRRRSETWMDEISAADRATVDSITSKYRGRFGYA